MQTLPQFLRLVKKMKVPSEHGDFGDIDQCDGDSVTVNDDVEWASDRMRDIRKRSDGSPGDNECIKGTNDEHGAIADRSRLLVPDHEEVE